MIEKVHTFDNLGIFITYRIGQDAKDNFDILENSSPTDLWFHVLHEPSPHVVAVLPSNFDRDDLRAIRKQGAVLCKQYSKAASSKKVAIMCAWVKDVAKTEIVGSVTVEKFKTITV